MFKEGSSSSHPTHSDEQSYNSDSSYSSDSTYSGDATDSDSELDELEQEFDECEAQPDLTQTQENEHDNHSSLPTNDQKQINKDEQWIKLQNDIKTSFLQKNSLKPANFTAFKVVSESQQMKKQKKYQEMGVAQAISAKNPIDLLNNLYKAKFQTLDPFSIGASAFEILLLLAYVFFFFRFSSIQMDVIVLILNALFVFSLPRWKSFLKQTFDSNMKTCFVCVACKIIHVCETKHETFKCSSCDHEISHANFQYSSLVQQLKNNLLDPEFAQSLFYYKKHIHKPGFLSDFYDGAVFQNFKEKYFPKEGPNDLNLGLEFNTDSFDTSENTHVWPTFMRMMNVHRDQRSKTQFNPCVAIIKKSASTETFEACYYLLVTELLQLFAGINVNKLNVKGFLMSICCDLKARDKVLKQQTCTAQFGCCFCTVAKRLKGIFKKVILSASSLIPRSKEKIIQAVLRGDQGFKSGFCQFFRLEYFSPDIICSVDPMHNLCLGVCKRVFQKIVPPNKRKQKSRQGNKSEKNEKEQIKKHEISNISKSFLATELQRMKFPTNYNHQIKKLHISKAIDYLLVFGYCASFFAWIPVIGTMIADIGQIIRIVFKKTITFQDLSELDDIISKFLLEYEVAFIEEKTPPNFHLLRHLPRDLLLFGPGWTHNLFSFENFNHLMNLNIKTTNNFDKRILSNFNSHHLLRKILEEVAERNPKIKSILVASDKLRKRKEHGIWIEKTNIGYKREKFCCSVQLASGEVGEIDCKDKDDKIYFFGDDGTQKEIKAADIEKPIIRTFKISQSDGKWVKNPTVVDVMSIHDCFG